MARTCSSLAEYMEEARALIGALGVRTIYLATDSEQVVSDTRNFPDVRFLYLANTSRFGLTVPEPKQLWDDEVKRRAKRPVPDSAKAELSRTPGSPAKAPTTAAVGQRHWL